MNRNEVLKISMLINTKNGIIIGAEKLKVIIVKMIIPVNQVPKTQFKN